MKTDHPISINESRKMELPGGYWQNIDVVHQGKVAIIQCLSMEQLANEVLAQIHKIIALDDTLQYSDIAVLARHGIDKNELSCVRSVLHQASIYYCYTAVREDSFPLHAVKGEEFKHVIILDGN